MYLTLTDMIINELRLIHWINDKKQITIHSKKINGDKLKLCYSIQSIGILKRYVNWNIGDWVKLIDSID